MSDFEFKVVKGKTPKGSSGVKKPRQKSSKHPTKSLLTKGILQYTKDGIFNVLDENKKPFEPNITVINKDDIYIRTNIGYSLPENDAHKPWTKRQRLRRVPSHLDICAKYWSPFRDGLVVYGNIKPEGFEVIILRSNYVY